MCRSKLLYFVTRLLSFVLFKNYFDDIVLVSILFQRALCCVRNSPGRRQTWIKTDIDSDCLLMSPIPMRRALLPTLAAA